MQTHSSPPARSLSDNVISAYRSVFYRASESIRLRIQRSKRWSDNGNVTVVIPTFNRKELLLDRALPSVMAQTHRKVRAIVVDHGSADETYEAVRQVQMTCWRVRAVRIQRKQLYPPTAENHWYCGPVQPLNAGLDRIDADSGWIARMDDDDEWLPDHIERSLKFARAGNFEFVSAAHVCQRGRVAPYNMGDGTLVGGCQTWLYRSYLKFFRYNKDCWRKPWNRVNDTDLQDRMWHAGVRMGYRDEVSCRIMPRPGEDSIGLASYIRNRDNVESAYAF